MRLRPGMTLMEVVVALTVTGIAVAAGYGALATLVDHGDRADEVAEAVVHQAVLRQTLAEWLAHVRVSGNFVGPAFEGLDGERDGEPDDVVVFLTTARTPLNARETIVMLYIDRDESTPERGLVAALVPWHGTSRAGETPAPLSRTQPGTRRDVVRRRLELVPEATSLDIRYRSGLLDDASWLPSWISSTIPPSGVELLIGTHDPAALPPLLRLPLRVSVRSVR